MGLKIIKGAAYPIGVDLGSASVKMAQLRQTGQTLELVAAGAVELPHDRVPFDKRTQLLTQSVRTILRSNDFKTRNCVLSLPAEVTFVHHVKIPKLPKSQVAGAVEWELQGKLPYPVEQAVIRHIIAGDAFGEGEPKQEVIVVAAPKATLHACLSIARRAKLEVTAINVEPCALVECFTRLFPESAGTPRTMLYIDMGAVSTQVVISHGNRIVFARNLLEGGEQLDQTVAEGLGLPVEQAHTVRRDLARGDLDADAENELVRLLARSLDGLTGELTQCLRYYESVFRSQPVERVIFLGGEAYDKRLCQAIAQRLNLPAQIGDPLVRIERAQGAGAAAGLTRREPQPDWAVAVGLSLGAAA